MYGNGKKSPLEDEITQVVKVSKDRTIQSREFTNLFRYDGDAGVDWISAPGKYMWHKLTAVVSIIRKRPGSNMDELMAQTGFSACELRQCIRLIISLGGEVEVICEEWQHPNEGKFFLHN